MMTRPMIPISATAGFMFVTNSGILASNSNGSPRESKPKAIGNCLRIMITPIPDMKPETTL